MCHFPLDLRSWTISKEFEKLAVNKHNCKETECLAIYPASKQASDQPLALKAVETMSRLSDAAASKVCSISDCKSCSFVSNLFI